MSVSSPITAQTVVRRNPEALAADISGEMVLMSIEHHKYYGLDDIGTEIWRRIEQPIAVAELCQALSSTYDGDPATIEHDVVTLLDQLASQELVQVVTA
jgi:hypothetical protein